MKTKTLLVFIVGILLISLPIVDAFYFNFKFIDWFGNFVMIVSLGSLFIGFLTLIQFAYMVAIDLHNLYYPNS